MENAQKSELSEKLREQGKLMFFHNDGDEQMRSQGLEYLISAYTLKDPEASYIVAKLLLEGALKVSEGDGQEYALNILCSLADNGDLASRELLDRICAFRYSNSPCASTVKRSGRLVDFDGKLIKIDRKGLLTPIDAELKYVDGKNIFSLSANIVFLYGDEIPDADLFESAILDGIMQWQGEYTVFGGQDISVRLNLTTEPRLFDNVLIFPLTSDLGNTVCKINGILGNKSDKGNLSRFIKDKRSFATNGIKWSVKSRKIIYIQCEDNNFDNYDELCAVAKHEFGHALGLGDLYYSPEDNLPGVEKGSFAELDSFYVTDKLYNLVMCDHHGPISNNDIEMIILAFRDNEAQQYQSGKFRKKISEALGKGN